MGKLVIYYNHPWWSYIQFFNGKQMTYSQYENMIFDYIVIIQVLIKANINYYQWSRHIHQIVSDYYNEEKLNDI